MLDFFRSIFKGVFIFFVLLGVVGLLIGVIYAFGLAPSLGFLVLVTGSITLVLSVGLISTILVMDERLESIATRIYEIERKLQISQGNNYSSENRLEKIQCPNCKKELDGGYSSCPYCGYKIKSRYNSVQSQPNFSGVIAKIDKKICSKCKKEVDGESSKCSYCGNDTFE